MVMSELSVSLNQLYVTVLTAVSARAITIIDAKIALYSVFINIPPVEV